MSSVIEIEWAVEQLSPEDLRSFREWFAQREAAEWDRQFESDVAAGRLDALANEAIGELRKGQCTDL